MILTDREIQIALGKRSIIIDPAPPEKHYSSTSVDLTLDPILTIFNDPVPGIEQTIDPVMKKDIDTEELLKSFTSQITISEDGYVLHPGKLILAYTKEYLDLRQDTKYAARVEGKSSHARMGLAIHITAPTIHAGFDGRVRLEMINHGRFGIRLRNEMRICQLIFEQTTGTPNKGYNEQGGQFSGQKPK